MHHFDVIFKIDWLAKHYANLECHRKSIDFRIPREQEFIDSPAKTPPGIISAL